jgi:hypothetical protein
VTVSKFCDKRGQAREPEANAVALEFRKFLCEQLTKLAKLCFFGRFVCFVYQNKQAVDVFANSSEEVCDPVAQGINECDMAAIKQHLPTWQPTPALPRERQSRIRR